MYLYNNFTNSDNWTGLQGWNGLEFASEGIATPVNFSLNASIGGYITISYTSQSDLSAFRYNNVASPDWEGGSYMGFRTSQGNYGWFEVTWTARSDEFQILSGAYESDPGVAILAGAGGAAPIPEPGTWAAMAIFAGGAAFAGWRRRKSAKMAA